MRQNMSGGQKGLGSMSARPQTTPAAMTQLLNRANQGDQSATDELFPLVYDELRLLAAKYLAGERPGHTLQPTALVHEAYLRLLGPEETNWENRRHFFAAAALAIRRILVDHARGRAREKRGGSAHREPVSDEIIAIEGTDVDLIALDEALTRLAAMDREIAEIVELRFFGGLSVEETAQSLGISPSTVARQWRFARTWLHRELSGDG